MAKKNRKRLKNFYMAILVVTIAVLSWVNYNSKQFEVLYSQDYTETFETSAVVIRNESMTELQGNVDFTVENGERVSMNQVIADSANVSFTEFYNREIDIINWLLENEVYVDQSFFQEDLDKINDKLSEIEEDIKWAENFDKDDLESLNAEREELLEKRALILSSFQYIGTDKEGLLELKEKYSSAENSTGSSITPKKLDLAFPGYIFFNSDGYENLLNVSVLEYITPQYLKNLDEYNISQDSGNSQTVKIVDDTFMYLAVTVSKDFQLANESKVEEAKADVLNTIESDRLKEYYNYLNSRIDVLKTFPTITYKYADEKYSGYIVDIREYGDEKVILIELKDEISRDFFTNRTVDINIVTYSEDGYIIPKKSIVNVDGKDNLVVLHKGFLKKYLEVTVSKINDSEVFLDASENESITDGMQIILNP